MTKSIFEFNLSNYFFGRSEKNEKNLSAKQDQKKKNPWIFGPYEDKKWTQSN